MKYFEHIDAVNIEQAASELQNGAKMIAGGTDLLGTLKDKILPEYPEKIVNIKTISELSGIDMSDSGIRIGANTKLSEIEKSSAIKNKFPILAEAAKSVASPLIRNQATIGGNICQDTRCWYYRYPNQIGGRVNCIRKGGEGCSAHIGEHRYHSIFGAMKVSNSSCNEGCPAHVDIPEYLEQLRAGNIDDAAQILMKKNPIPAVTSRVCAHFCQQECRRDEYDERVNIGQIERYVGDYILENPDKFMASPERESGKKIAIIGAGPSALTAAYYLRKEGHNITVFEKMEEPGGMLTYAIPEYRLPKEVVRKTISALERMGIKFNCSTTVGEDISYDEIKKNYDSVYLDTGAWKRTVIGVDGEELTTFGLEFLVEVKSWMKDKPGTDVVVVGGGNVAVDVAVTAKRLGAKNVTMVSLESREEAPAGTEEIDHVINEGIEYLSRRGPKAILRDGNKITGLELKACVSLKDEEGRFAPKYDDNDVITIDTDSILLATGQATDLSFLGDSPQINIEKGRISTEINQMTSEDGVFAGGDVVTGPSTVVKAIAAGRQAALAMDEYLGSPIKAEKNNLKDRFLKHDDSVYDNSKSVEANLRKVSDRSIDKEDDLGLELEKVITEAKRCFNCGCYAVNPSDTAIALMALNAVVITNKKNYSADEFFGTNARIEDLLEQDEIVKYIELNDSGRKMVYSKFRERDAIDFAVVSMAGSFVVNGNHIEDASMVLGAVAPVPLRLVSVEEYLKGKEINEDIANHAAELAMKDADPLSQNDYKIQISKTLIKREILGLI